MDVALCTLNGVEYTGKEFEALRPQELALNRRHLVCVKCGTSAFFRKAATSGQAACFGARPHENCSLAAPEAVRVAGGGPDRDILRNPGNHIVIDLQYGGAEAGIHVPNQAGPGNGSGGSFSGSGPRPNAKMSRRLRPLLRTLIYSEAFRNSAQTIELPERGTFSVNDLFVNFTDIEERHIGRFRGYWGLVYDVGVGMNSTVWINTGKQEDVSIRLTIEQVRPFLDYHKVELADLEGMHVLVFGNLDRSYSGKRWINPAGIEYFAFCND